MRLTRDEILLLASVTAALLIGAVVTHCRAERRLFRPPPASTPAVKP